MFGAPVPTFRRFPRDLYPEGVYTSGFRRFVCMGDKTLLVPGRDEARFLGAPLHSQLLFRPFQHVARNMCWYKQIVIFTVPTLAEYSLLLSLYLEDVLV